MDWRQLGYPKNFPAPPIGVSQPQPLNEPQVTARPFLQTAKSTIIRGVGGAEFGLGIGRHLLDPARLGIRIRGMHLKNGAVQCNPMIYQPQGAKNHPDWTHLDPPQKTAKTTVSADRSLLRLPDQLLPPKLVPVEFYVILRSF